MAHTVPDSITSANLQFDFGENWQNFSYNALNEDRFLQAVVSLKTLLEVSDFSGKSFLDIGCGTGLFSIAAKMLKASRVLGIDINPKCIVVSHENARRFFSEHHGIEFQQANILDTALLEKIGTFDIVYAWGSLHHTGKMYSAIEQTLKRVAPQGTLVLAIYNRHSTSILWRFIKKIYNISPVWIRRLLVFLLTPVIYIAKALVTRKNPLEKERGMNFMHDVIDWIGGYPYEYASISEMTTWMKNHGFELVKAVPANTPIGCNEFVFRRLA